MGSTRSPGPLVGQSSRLQLRRPIEGDRDPHEAFRYGHRYVEPAQIGPRRRPGGKDQVDTMVCGGKRARFENPNRAGGRVLLEAKALNYIEATLCSS